MSGKDMDQGFKKELSQFILETKRVIASNKRQYWISLEEGKKAIIFDVYKRLCDVLHQGEGEDFIFAHAFLTMEWNLMARRDKCVNMHIKQIQRRSYCLIFYLGASKGNQTGERSSDPWHVYSNPKNPTIYPVLALAKYTFSNTDILTTNYPLFPGNCQCLISHIAALLFWCEVYNPLVKWYADMVWMCKLFNKWVFHLQNDYQSKTYYSHEALSQPPWFLAT